LSSQQLCSVKCDCPASNSARCLRERGFAFTDILPAFATQTTASHRTDDLTTGKRATGYSDMSKEGSMPSSSPLAVRRSASSRLARRTPESSENTTQARLAPDGTVVEILPDDTTRPFPVRADWSRVDETTEAQIARQQRADDDEAMQDAASWPRSVRQRTGLSQAEYARCIEVSVRTLRDWEGGKAAPTGPAHALLRLIDHSPKEALAVLGS
jgi:putative transcriptional regulator